MCKTIQWTGISMFIIIIITIIIIIIIIIIDIWARGLLLSFNIII